MFTDARAPFLQLVTLGATLGATAPIVVATYQNDTEFGLLVRPPTRPRDQPPRTDAHAADSIYRYRELTELPVGTIGDVTVNLSTLGNISSVSFMVSGSPLLLIAGEVHERSNRRLDFVLDDEPILVFTDPTTADAVSWRNPDSLRSPHRYTGPTGT